MKKDWLETLFPTNAERTVPWPELEGETVTPWRPTETAPATHWAERLN